MRCLYCNKKLSLLKLAKGDEFCSSEHFDAHQLQLSKNAIQRLMGVDQEGPKTPLIFKTQEEASPQRTIDLREIARQEEAPAAVVNKAQEKAPPRRDIDLREMARQEETLLVADSPVEQAPPYALFIAEPLPPLAMKPPAPVAGELDPDTSSAPELSFPIQEIEATVCLLNLHARVSPSETTPLNWASLRNFILAAEGFPREVVPPSFTPSPDFPQLENSAPAEPDPPTIDVLSIEPAAPVEPVASVEPAAPIEPAAPASSAPPRVPFLIAPSFLERRAPPAEVDPAGPVQSPPTLVPILKAGLYSSDVTGAIARPEQFEETAAQEIQSFSAPLIQSTPELPIPLSVVLPALREKAHLNGRLALSPVVGLPGTVFEMGKQEAPSIDSALLISESLLVQPSAALLDPKQTLDRQPRIARTTSPMPGDSISASEPFPVPPDYAAPIALAAQRLRTRAMNLAFPAPLAIHPFGKEPAFANPSVSAAELGLPTVFTNLPSVEPLFTPAWEYRATRTPLPASIADSVAPPVTALPMLPYHPGCILLELARLEAPSIIKRRSSTTRREIASARTYDPSRFSEPHSTRLSALGGLPNKGELCSGSTIPLSVGWPFSTASSPVLAELESRSFISASLPDNTPVIMDYGTVALCPHFTNGQPCLSAAPTPPPAKFLPHREDPILPSAGSWAPLTSLHR